MKPSIRRILWNDWPSLFVGFSIVIIWIIALLLPVLREGAQFGSGLPIGISILSAAILTWRIGRIGRLFARGIETEGILRHLQITRDRGRFEYDYPVGDEVISSWCPVHKSKEVMRFEQGQRITVLYDRKNPEKSIVRDLFERQNQGEGSVTGEA